MTVDHPLQSEMWRHDPPQWRNCWVCGGPTCWVEMDLGFKHPECEAAPGYRMTLGKEIDCESELDAS